MQSPEDRKSVEEYRHPSGGSLVELLKEAVSPYVPEHHHDDAFSAIEETLENCQPTNRATACKVSIFEVLREIYGDTRLPSDVRRLACSAAIGANDPQFSRSYQFYADYFGVTRAAIQADARDMQKKFGVRSRRDKSDDARETSRRLAASARPVAIKNASIVLSILPKQ